MSLVVDVSAIVSLALPDEDRTYAEWVLDRLAIESGVVPPLFWFEIWNALSINVRRRKRITAEPAFHFLAILETLPLEISSLPHQSQIMGLTLSHELTAYDGAYVALAKQRCCSLATLDEPLKAICRAADVNVSIFE